MISKLVLYRLCWQVFCYFSILIGLSWICSSCAKNKLDIQQDFPFEVNVMPVPKEISIGKTIEIRISIIPKGEFKETKYFIRYFQFDGRGKLRYQNNLPYQPNDIYPLASTSFRLYYTSHSDVSQSIDVWISDNFGNEKQLKFNFNSIE